MRNAGVLAGIVLGLIAAGVTSFLWTPLMVLIALAVATSTMKVVDSTTRKQINS